MKRLTLGLITLVVLFYQNAAFCNNGDMGGTSRTGSESLPYLIEDINDFKTFSTDSSYWAAGVHVRLQCDLNLESEGTYSQAPIAPDKDYTAHFNYTPYEGVFDGNGHIIRNLNVSGYCFCGLFGCVNNDSAEIYDLGIVDANVIGNTYVGALVGRNDKANITNCYSTGTIIGEYSVGGLIGDNFLTADCNMIDCNSSCSVAGEVCVGGLVGRSRDMFIFNCHATGPVTANEYVSLDNVEDSGGLIGRYEQSNAMPMQNCYSTGTVEGGKNAGGLIGWCQGDIKNCYSSSPVTAIGDNTGGFVGFCLGNITDCYATGDVNGCQSWYTGGFVGCFQFSTLEITNCYATGDVKGRYCVGGFVGQNHYGPTISKCYASGSIKGLGETSGNLGGFVGINMTGPDGYYISTITQCYAVGDVNGYFNCGGFAGDNRTDCEIDNCYSLGSVSSYSGAGGFIGLNYGGSVEKCYSTASVEGATLAGGFCGIQWMDNSEISDCFWNNQLTSQSLGCNLDPNNPGTVTNLYGRTTSQMQTSSTYTDYGWDFKNETANGTDDIWWIDNDYPRLTSQNHGTDLTGPYGIEFADYAIFTAAWQSSSGDANYNDKCDFNNDNKIDYKDLQIFISHWLNE